MRIKATDTLLGYPVVEIRKLLRQADRAFYAMLAEQVLKIDAPAALALLVELETAGDHASRSVFGDRDAAHSS
jgi:hypothetical protein